MRKHHRRGRLLAGASLVTAASALLAGTAAAALPGPDEVTAGGEGPVWAKVLNTSVVEGDAGQKILSFPVTLSKASDNPVVVSMKTYKFSGAPAEQFGDYVPKFQDLKFNPGQTKRFFEVVVKGDKVDELIEYVGAMATGADKATILDKSGSGKIVDNDAPPKVSVEDVTEVEGTGAPTAFHFSVSLSAKSEKQVAVQASAAAGSALTPADWQAATAKLTFTPGQTKKGYAVSVVGDETPENDENFTVKLSDAVNAGLGDAIGIGKIIDDDPSSGGGGNGGAGNGGGGSTGPSGGDIEQALGSDEQLALDQASEEHDNGVMPWLLLVAGLAGIGLVIVVVMRRRRRREA